MCRLRKILGAKLGHALLDDPGHRLKQRRIRVTTHGKCPHCVGDALDCEVVKVAFDGSRKRGEECCIRMAGRREGPRRVCQLLRIEACGALFGRPRQRSVELAVRPAPGLREGPCNVGQLLCVAVAHAALNQPGQRSHQAAGCSTAAAPSHAMGDVGQFSGPRLSAGRDDGDRVLHK
eukprot:scaffold5276_cov124-Isochrysis_galbana.AAC.2